MSAPLMDSRSELALSVCMPQFAEEIRLGHADFAAQTGSFAVITSGYRTYAEQNILFAKGPTVTKARGGYSNHNFAMAVDMEPTEAGSVKFIPDWNTAHPHWTILVACMKNRGLAWGGDWKNMKGDLDHFQLGGVPATPTQADRDAFASGGLSAVWVLYQPK